MSDRDLDRLLVAARQGSFTAELPGIHLAGARIELVSLRGARLEGANLAGATLRLVDLAGASLEGADLEGAKLIGVDLSGATLAGVHARTAVLQQCTLADARLPHADLRRAALGGCDLSRADLSHVDLSRAQLIGCRLDQALLRGARLFAASTLRSSFAGADFTTARHFFMAHEIVAEILSREVGDDFARAALVGAILADRRRCYPEWKALLADRPAERELALSIMAAYPESGFARALGEGWSPGTVEGIESSRDFETATPGR